MPSELENAYEIHLGTIESMTSMKPIAPKLGSTDGAEIAEAALVLPLVFMLLLGAVWFGRAFNIYSTIQQAAQQGAITAARASCATCVAGNGWSGTSFPSDTTVDNAISAVLQASNLDPNQIQVKSPSPTSCKDPARLATCTTSTHNISICRQVLLNSSPSVAQTAQCGTEVSFQYPFQSSLPFTSLNMQKIVLPAQAQSRMEN